MVYIHIVGWCTVHTTSNPKGIFTTGTTFSDHTPDSTDSGVFHRVRRLVCGLHKKNLTERFLGQHGVGTCLLTQACFKFANSATESIPSRRVVAQWPPSAGPHITLLWCPYLVPRDLEATVTNALHENMQLELHRTPWSSLESVLTEVQQRKDYHPDRGISKGRIMTVIPSRSQPGFRSNASSCFTHATDKQQFPNNNPLLPLMY